MAENQMRLSEALGMLAFHPKAVKLEEEEFEQEEHLDVVETIEEEYLDVDDIIEEEIMHFEPSPQPVRIKIEKSGTAVVMKRKFDGK